MRWLLVESAVALLLFAILMAVLWFDQMWFTILLSWLVAVAAAKQIGNDQAEQ